MAVNKQRYKDDPEYREKLLEEGRQYRERNREKERERARVRQAKLRAEHPEKVKAMMADYRRRNREKLTANNKKWTEKNKEKVRQYRQAYREKNGDKIRERMAVYHREWFIKNKERRTIQLNEWRAANKDKLDQARLRRKERKASRPRPDFCEITGLPGKITFDHDHATGEFRGWISNQCNRIAGQANDDFNLLRLVADYLERWKLGREQPANHSVLLQTSPDIEEVQSV